MSESMLEIANVFSGFLTPVIGLLAAYIAWQQWQTRKERLRFELFDKRYAVYKGVKEFIEKVLAEGYPSRDDIFDLRRKTHDAEFLFAEDIRDHIDEIIEKGNRLRTLNKYLKDTSNISEDKDREALSEEEEKLINWFDKGYTRTRHKFAQDLKINE